MVKNNIYKFTHFTKMAKHLGLLDEFNSLKPNMNSGNRRDLFCELLNSKGIKYLINYNKERFRDAYYYELILPSKEDEGIIEISRKYREYMDKMSDYPKIKI